LQGEVGWADLVGWANGRLGLMNKKTRLEVYASRVFVFIFLTQ
jgi:hypothetical protein